MKQKKLPWFTRAAKWASHTAGRPATFMIALGIIPAWALTGPIFNFSNTWQLVINTGTTIITILMVFLIQSTQNRDTEALQIKLDELIRSISNARNALLEELERIRQDYLACRVCTRKAEAKEQVAMMSVEYHPSSASRWRR